MDLRSTLDRIGWTLEKSVKYLRGKRSGKGSPSDGDWQDMKNAERRIIDEAIYGDKTTELEWIRLLAKHLRMGALGIYEDADWESPRIVVDDDPDNWHDESISIPCKCDDDGLPIHTTRLETKLRKALAKLHHA